MSKNLPGWIVEAAEELYRDYYHFSRGHCVDPSAGPVWGPEDHEYIYRVAVVIARHSPVPEKDEALVKIANWAVGTLPTAKKLDKINTEAHRALGDEQESKK